MNFLVPYLVRWDSLNRSRYYQIFKILAEKGHQIHIIQPPIMKSKDTGFIEYEQDSIDNLYLHDIDINGFFWNTTLPFNKIIKKGYYCLKINRSIKKFIDEYKIDAIIFYNMALFPLAKRKDILSIYDLGDDHIDLLRHELGKFSNRLILGWAENLLKKTLQRTDVVFSVSHFLTEKYCSNSIHLANGVSPDKIKPGSGEHLKSQYAGPVIGFVGSLEYFIHFDYIIEAASRLKNCTFVIAGGGREYDRLVNERSRRGLDNLIITGGLPHDEILNFIDSFDICLNLFKKSPLTDGACPIKLFEYMAFKKPIISTRIQEVQRIDKEFIYWADDVDELVKTIMCILDNPRAVIPRVEREYNELLQHYTWPRIADTFLKNIGEADEKNCCRSS